MEKMFGPGFDSLQLHETKDPLWRIFCRLRSSISLCGLRSLDWGSHDGKSWVKSRIFIENQFFINPYSSLNLHLNFSSNRLELDI